LAKLFVFDLHYP